MPLGSSGPGKARNLLTREPGDLPSAIFTGRRIGRGILVARETCGP